MGADQITDTLPSLSEQPVTSSEQLPVDQVILGDCRDVLRSLPDESVDVVFADPPYNLQLQDDLWRPNLTLVDAVDAEWDRFESFAAYDEFTREWLDACRRVLKPTGTLWVIGTYHNIYRVGVILQDLGYWILNNVAWVKANPMPNFRGVRFTNSHETLVWAQKDRGKPYTFNYRAMKEFNDGVQMRSDWNLPICSGSERLKINGHKAHPTQKPEALLYRVILSSSKSGDIILDPFFGTGTTGAVAVRLHRHFIGIERLPGYVELARERIGQVRQMEFDPPVFFTPDPRREPRIPFGTLLEHGFLEPGQILYFGSSTAITARIMADSSLEYDGQRGSIHQIAQHIRKTPCNGWDHWYFLDPISKELQVIDVLRQEVRKAALTETLPLPETQPKDI